LQESIETDSQRLISLAGHEYDRDFTISIPDEVTQLNAVHIWGLKQGSGGKYKLHLCCSYLQWPFVAAIF